jgi:hypothetical protein
VASALCAEATAPERLLLRTLEAGVGFLRGAV